MNRATMRLLAVFGLALAPAAAFAQAELAGSADDQAQRHAHAKAQLQNNAVEDATEALIALCYEPYALACFDAGQIIYRRAYRRFDVPERNARFATKMVARSCVLGLTKGCDDMAMRYRDGLGVEAEPLVAFSYEVQGCLQGSGAACLTVGASHANGEYFGVPVEYNLQNALRSYAMACDRKEAAGCLEAGHLYVGTAPYVADRAMTAPPPANDIDKAMDFYEKAQRIETDAQERARIQALIDALKTAP